MTNVTAESIERRGYTKGLPCELAVIDVFDERNERTLPRPLLRDELAVKGFAKTTIGRTLPRLVDSGNLVVRPGNVLELACRDLPWTWRVDDPRTETPNRFGQDSPTAMADYVRGHYADRLDELWMTPNAYLARVLRAVELAGRIAEAACLDRPHALELAVDEYKREWLNRESNMWRKPLDAVRLFEALQVGLFVEEFEGDEEVRATLAEHYERMKAERRDIIVRTNAKNVERIARGEKAEQLPQKRFETPRDALRGLVTHKGGDRVGLVRLRAYLTTLGIETDGKEEGMGSHYSYQPTSTVLPDSFQ